MCQRRRLGDPARWPVKRPGGWASEWDVDTTVLTAHPDTVWPVAVRPVATIEPELVVVRLALHVAALLAVRVWRRRNVGGIFCGSRLAGSRFVGGQKALLHSCPSE